jgi:hypothetical protein
MSAAATTLRRLIDSDGHAAVDTLLELHDALEAIDTSFMLGDWEGGALRTGHAGEAQLVAMGWVGKAFHGEDDVDPIIVRDEQGRRVASPIMGKATLRMVSYRGTPTATMIYDRHPIFDHFRKVGDDVVMGVMDRKGDAAPLCFWLRRLSAPGTAAVSQGSLASRP